MAMPACPESRLPRVLVFTTQGKDAHTGVRTYCDALATALEGRGFEVVIRTPEDASAWLRFFSRGVMRIVRALRINGFGPAIGRLFCFLKCCNVAFHQRGHVDIVLAQDLHPGAAANVVGLPTWTTCHFSDPIGEVIRSSNIKPSRQWMVRRTLQFLMNRHRRFVCLSKTQAEVMRRYVPSSEIKVLPTICRATPCRAAEAHGGFRIVMAGRLEPLKGQDRLVRLLHALDREDVELWLLGEGPDRTRLQELAESLGVASRVKFLGYVQGPQSVFKECDLYLHASLMECLPLTPIEAVLSGIEAWSYETPGYNDWGLFDGTPEIRQETAIEVVASFVRERILAGKDVGLMQHQRQVAETFLPDRVIGRISELLSDGSAGR